MGANGRTMVKVRIIAPPDVINELANALCDALEKDAYEVIEQSKPQPGIPPDDDKNRLYMTAISK